MRNLTSLTSWVPQVSIGGHQGFTNGLLQQKFYLLKSQIQIASFLYKENVNDQNVTNEGNSTDGKHKTALEPANDQQLIIFGSSLLAVAALVFIVKNRETAKIGFLSEQILLGISYAAYAMTPSRVTRPESIKSDTPQHMSSIIMEIFWHLKQFSNRALNRNRVKLTGSTGRFQNQIFRAFQP